MARWTDDLVHPASGADRCRPRETAPVPRPAGLRAAVAEARTCARGVAAGAARGGIHQHRSFRHDRVRGRRRSLCRRARARLAWPEEAVGGQHNPGRVASLLLRSTFRAHRLFPGHVGDQRAAWRLASGQTRVTGLSASLAAAASAARAQQKGARNTTMPMISRYSRPFTTASTGNSGSSSLSCRSF